MKKLIFTLALTFGILTTASAQEVGQMWVGGTFGLWSSKTDGGSNQLSYKVMPEFGFILSENMAVGIALGGGHTHTGSSDFTGTVSGNASRNFYKVNPFLRYSFLKGSLGSLFVDGGVGYAYAKTNGSDNKFTTFDVGFKPGVALNVSSKVALIAKTGFLGYENINSGGLKTNSFGFDFNLDNVELGVNIIF